MRYLVILSEQGVTNCNLSGGWRIALDEDGVRVWVREGAVQRADSRPEAPVLLGRVHAQSAPTSNAPCRTGADICRQYWGRYVAVIRSAGDGLWSILRDPSGSVQIGRASCRERV